ncbi:MAG: CheR family methyltransferase [Kiritimatiellia bacterium]|nr:CheR family methyltransferase [Kiritimatiellia bacterium]
MPAKGYKPIEQLLKDHIGLDPASLGPKAVGCAAAERMRLLGIGAVSSYLELVSTSPAELEALIELVVIPETWFFRDREPFIFLANFIRSEWKPFHATDTLRIISAPCATGEEPYSIVMTCLDCGLTQNQFIVDAIDINKKFLGKAQNAVYGHNSFRGADLAFRERYFNQEGHVYSLKPNVRVHASFFKANIIEPESFPPFTPYDIVFCRNLMIYLHDLARTKTIAAIDRLLAAGGLLFVGHAEAIPVLMETFETVNHQGSFALRKRAQKQINLFSPDIMQKTNFLPSAVQNAAVHPSSPSGLRRVPQRLHAASQSEQPAPAIESGSGMFGRQTPAAGAYENIEHATRLADEGSLKAAAEICERMIKTDARNARAHFLMGLIREAEGDNHGAEECFNRAIYLDADFSDAILHLAVLKEESGDSASADLLRRRAVLSNTQDAQLK